MKLKLILLSLSLIISGTIVSNALADQNGKNDNERTSTSSINNDDERDDDVDRFSTSTATSTKEDEEEDKIAEEHRSDVAKFVKTLLNVAEKRDGGIGEKVRIVAREQASSSDKIVGAINTIEKRNDFKTFLIGTDYKNIGKIRSEIAQTRNRIDELNRELLKLATSTDKTAIENEIKSLEASQTKIEDFMKKNENRFSLFGWFVKLFQ